MAKVVQKRLILLAKCYAEGYQMFPNEDERFSLRDNRSLPDTPLTITTT